MVSGHFGKTLFLLKAVLFYAAGAYNNDDVQTMVERIQSELTESLTGNCNDGVETTLNLLNADGSFRGITYKDNYRLQSRPFAMHIGKLRSLAEAYNCKSFLNLYYKSPVIAIAVSNSLQWFSTKCPVNEDPGWWNFKIVIPSDLLVLLFLMKKPLSQTIINASLDRYVAATKVWDPQDGTGTNSGANFAYRARIAILEGILRGPSFFVGRYNEFMDAIDRELIQKRAYNEEGIQKDYCLHEHNFYASKNSMVRHTIYNGAYDGILVDLPYIFNLFWGTSFAVPKAAYTSIVLSYTECHQWLIWNTAIEPSCTGRKIATKGVVPYMRAYRSLKMAEAMLPWGVRTGELTKAIRRFGQRQPALQDALVGNKNLFNSAMLIHRRPTYMTSLRMISERVYRPENWVSVGYFDATLNSKGYYEGDGFTCIMRTGEEWGTTGREVFLVYDWAHIPGVTVEDVGTVPEVSTKRKDMEHSINQESFVGGVSNGEYGAAGMIYNRSTVRVYAKKAWFYFDEEFIALGADIKGKTPLEASVHTTVNQVWLNGTITIKTASGAIKTMTVGEYKLKEKPEWVLHDKILYVPLTPAKTFNIKGEERQIEGVRQNVFQFVINHGRSNAPFDYTYVVRPSTETVEDANNYVERELPRVYQNDENAQAVSKRSIKVTSAIIYSPDARVYIKGMRYSCSEKCMVLVKKEDDDVLKVSVSRPSNPSTPTSYISLTVKGHSKLTGPDVIEHDADKRMTTIRRKVFGGSIAGKSNTVKYTVVPW